jgi:hypothetical protein
MTANISSANGSACTSPGVQCAADLQEQSPTHRSGPGSAPVEGNNPGALPGLLDHTQELVPPMHPKPERRGGLSHPTAAAAAHATVEG